MMLQLPKAFLLLTARADHVEEQSLSDVMIHHVANHYYQGMESWAFSKGVLMMLIAAVILMATNNPVIITPSNNAPKQDRAAD